MKPKGDPLALADLAIEMAIKAGADAADAYVRSASDLAVEVRNGEVESLKQASTLGMGLRLMAKGRTVLVHTTDSSGFAILRMIQRGIDMAAALPEPKERALFAPAKILHGMPHPDPDLQSEPFKEKTARLIDLEKAMRSVPGVVSSVGASYGEVDGEMALVNSRGLRLYSPFCRLSLYAECIAERDEQTTTGGKYVTVSARSRLPEAEHIGRQAGERAVALLGARPVRSTKVPVIFAPQTGWTLLRCLVNPLRGDYVVQQRSYLADRLGKKVAADGVTIRDNALLSRGPASRAFDGEGSPATDTTVIRNGVLSAYLTDLSSAAKLGVACGGNAVRESYSARPQIGTSNFYLEPGPESPAEIISSTQRGLLVTVLSGWWVGMSPSTDVFSAAAMGHWIEDGEIAHPVRGITIGGAVRDMLGSIDRIGNDLEFTAETRTPTFRVAEMAISGT
jgi:PmbA protein